MSENSFDLAGIVKEMRAKLVVELGAGDGATAARIMAALPEDGRLFTVNWPNPPSGDSPGRYLEPWTSDPRLTLIYGDTRDPGVVGMVPGGIELLYIDSTHTAECAGEEWRLWEPKLADSAVVVVDDLNHNDMMAFWDGLVGDKRIECATVGVLRYKR